MSSQHHLDVKVGTTGEDATRCVEEVLTDVDRTRVSWRFLVETDTSTGRLCIVRFEGDLETLWQVIREVLLRSSRFIVLDVDCDYGSEGQEPS